jgi:hypothetical protein
MNIPRLKPIDTSIEISVIENIVCNARNISSEVVNCKSRKRESKEIRQIVMYFARKKYPKLSLAKIAGYYGLDHATCIHSIKVINNLMDSDNKFKYEIDLLRLEIETELDAGLLPTLIKERDLLTKIIAKHFAKIDILDRIISKLEGKKQEPEITAVKEISAKLINDFKSPYKEMETVNNRPYSGYRKHSL